MTRGPGPVGWTAIGLAAGLGALWFATDEGAVHPSVRFRAEITGRRSTMGDDVRISKHFTVGQVRRSAAADRYGIDNRPTEAALAQATKLAREVLDPIVELLGKPIVITSWYRSPELNKRIGGSSTSQHMFGEAADFMVPGIAAPDLARLILRSGRAPEFGQLIGYAPENGGQIHISLPTDRVRGDVRWSPRKGVYQVWKPLAPPGERLPVS